MKLIKVKRKDIKVDETNPRTITSYHLQKMKKSIEKFGYVNPIIVNDEFVILAGHTRYEAIKDEEIDVIQVSGLSDKKQKAFRIVENRSSELSLWDEDSLKYEAMELGEDEANDLKSDFDVNIDISVKSPIDVKTISSSMLDKKEEYRNIGDRLVTREEEKNIERLIEVTCPHCNKSMKIYDK